MKRKSLYFALVGLVVATAAGYQIYRLQRPANNIVIAQAGDFYLYAPLYLAVDNGFFSREGLDVRLITTGGDDKTWAAVLSGDAFFGVSDPAFIAVSGQQGRPGKIVGGLVNGVPFWGITKRADLSGVDDVRARQPLTVATFPSPSTAFALQSKLFKDWGAEPRIRQGAPGTLIPLVEAGQADIALELEPNVSQASARGFHITYSMAEIFGQFAITGLTTTQAKIDASPTTIRSAVCALQRSIDFIRDQRPQAVDLLAKRFPDIDRQVALSALDRVVAANIIPKSLKVTNAAWDNATQARYEVGDLKSKASTFTDYVDNRFADQAAKDCGH